MDCLPSLAGGKGVDGACTLFLFCNCNTLDKTDSLVSNSCTRFSRNCVRESRASKAIKRSSRADDKGGSAVDGGCAADRSAADGGGCRLSSPCAAVRLGRSLGVSTDTDCDIPLDSMIANTTSLTGVC